MTEIDHQALAREIAMRTCIHCGATGPAELFAIDRRRNHPED